jgi:hypothetical protein
VAKDFHSRDKETSFELSHQARTRKRKNQDRSSKIAPNAPKKHLLRFYLSTAVGFGPRANPTKFALVQPESQADRPLTISQSVLY